MALLMHSNLPLHKIVDSMLFVDQRYFVTIVKTYICNRAT